jgi:hypothetical protein
MLLLLLLLPRNPGLLRLMVNLGRLLLITVRLLECIDLKLVAVAMLLLLLVVVGIQHPPQCAAG